MTNRNEQSPDALQLFLIGVSAGLIAAVFPRVMASLTVAGDGVSVVLFSPGFLIAAGIFAVVVGVAMVWMYRGSKEPTKNLFLAALALPGILSGGTNTSGTVIAGQTAVARVLEEQEARQNRFIKEALGETVIETIDLGELKDVDISAGSSFLIPGIGNAYAAGGPAVLAEATTFSPNVRFKAPSQPSQYIILLDQSADRASAVSSLRELQQGQVVDQLQIRKSGDVYLLLDSEKRTKAEAAMKALRLKRELNINPRILRVK